MKKLLLLMGFMFFSGIAWAVPDWSPAVEYSTSQQVNTSQSAVCSVVVSGIGVTTGDMLVLQNTASGSQTGSTTSNVLTVVASSANFTTPVNYNGSPCNLFTNGLYVDDYTHSGKMVVDLQILNAI